MSKSQETYRLEQDFVWFQENQDQFQQQHPTGGHIVIKNKTVLGVWPTRNEALKEGINEFGYVSFLVRSIFDQKISAVNYTVNSAS